MIQPVATDLYASKAPLEWAMIVAGLAREEMLCEVVAYATVPNND
jgi:hypothetical protein